MSSKEQEEKQIVASKGIVARLHYTKCTRRPKFFHYRRYYEQFGATTEVQDIAVCKTCIRKMSELLEQENVYKNE